MLVEFEVLCEIDTTDELDIDWIHTYVELTLSLPRLLPCSTRNDALQHPGLEESTIDSRTGAFRRERPEKGAVDGINLVFQIKVYSF